MQIIDQNGKQRDCTNATPDPDHLGYMKVTYQSKVRTHDEWYPIKDFVKNNPNLENLVISGTQTKSSEDLEDLGVISNATADSLTDKNKNWQKDIFAGFTVWISRGLGESQTRKVITNTHNTLNLTPAWDITPNTSSQYVISFNVHDPQVSGNELPTVPKTDIVESKS